MIAEQFSRKSARSCECAPICVRESEIKCVCVCLSACVKMCKVESSCARGRKCLIMWVSVSLSPVMCVVSVRACLCTGEQAVCGQMGRYKRLRNSPNWFSHLREQINGQWKKNRYFYLDSQSKRHLPIWLKFWFTENVFLTYSSNRHWFINEPNLILWKIG